MTALSGRLFCEDKTAGNTDTPAAFQACLRDKKSVGIISGDRTAGVIKAARPVGAIACAPPQIWYRSRRRLPSGVRLAGGSLREPRADRG